jgi:hypothetical protein
VFKEQAKRQQGINQRETAKADTEKPDQPSIGVVVAGMLRVDGLGAHVA